MNMTVTDSFVPSEDCLNSLVGIPVLFEYCANLPFIHVIPHLIISALET